MTNKLFIIPMLIFIVLCLLVKHTAAKDNSNINLFEFHSSMWINLHHFCYELAKKPKKLEHLIKTLEKSGEDIAGLRSAINYYKNTFSKRKLLFDKELTRIKSELSTDAELVNLSKLEIPKKLRLHLEGILPLYRKHFWDKHDAANKKWIKSANKLLDLYGAETQKRLENLLKKEFLPATRVDISYKANWAGAYTTVVPRQIVISSHKRSYHGLSSLEILFHELVHTGSNKKINEILSQYFRDHKYEDNDQIWHAIQFFTVGEIVKQVLDEKGIKYTPYALKVGLFSSNRRWGKFKPLFEEYWKPYLVGDVKMRDALKELVDNIIKLESDIYKDK